jgi:hypothetical protein
MGHNFADDGLLDIPQGLFGGNLVHVDLGDFAVDEEDGGGGCHGGCVDWRSFTLLQYY